MKVKELIEKLQAFDQEMLVLVDGYEDGLTEPKEPIVIKVNLNVHNEWYYGKHKQVYKNDKEKEDCEAVYLSR
jgi:hypothetical protein